MGDKVIFLIAATSIFAACAEEGEKAQEKESLTIVWEDCPLYTELCDPPDQLHCVYDDSELNAQCAFVDLPATYSDDSQETVEVFVKRRPATEPRAGQLWLLMGGPSSAVSMEPLVQIFEESRKDLDIYIVERRGLGRSSRLSCPEQESLDSAGGSTIVPDELDACADHIQSTRGSVEAFRTTYAAMDVDRLVEATREPDDQVFVYGISYGTHWLNRLLQVSLQSFDGVIFDGGCPGASCVLSEEAMDGTNAVGMELLSRCAEDASCSAYLSDPAAVMGQLVQDLDSGHCSELGIDGETFKSIAMALLMSFDLRDYIPALVHRADRCEQRDVVAIDNLITELFSPKEAELVDRLQSSSFLMNLIHFNELTSEYGNDYVEKSKDMLFSFNNDFFWNTVDEWDWYYQPDQYTGKLVDTDIPVLFMNGSLDPQTPIEIADPFGVHFKKDKQTYVVVEDAAHGVLYQSPLYGYEEFHCGMWLTHQFLTDPLGDIEVDCATALVPMDFGGDPQTSMTIFGSEDAWE